MVYTNVTDGQTDRQTDRQTTCYLKTVLCTISSGHHAVKAKANLEIWHD